VAEAVGGGDGDGDVVSETRTVLGAHIPFMWFLSATLQWPLQHSSSFLQLVARSLQKIARTDGMGSSGF
jgi:hypothetical protein